MDNSKIYTCYHLSSPIYIQTLLVASSKHHSDKKTLPIISINKLFAKCFTYKSLNGYSKLNERIIYIGISYTYNPCLCMIHTPIDRIINHNMTNKNSEHKYTNKVKNLKTIHKHKYTNKEKNLKTIKNKTNIYCTLSKSSPLANCTNSSS